MKEAHKSEHWINRITHCVLSERFGDDYITYPFKPNRSDERQYSSPAFDIAMPSYINQNIMNTRNITPPKTTSISLPQKRLPRLSTYIQAGSAQLILSVFLREKMLKVNIS